LSSLSVTRVTSRLDKDDVLNWLLEASTDGIPVSLSKRNSPRTYWGIRIPPDGGISVYLSGVSVNMPRIAYEAQGDEIYFKAKLLQVDEKASETASARASHVRRVLSEGYSSPLLPSSRVGDSLRLMINMVGFLESMETILAKGIEDEVLGFVDQLLVELSSGEMRAAVLYDPKAGERLYSIDSAKIGPKETRSVKGWRLRGYTSGYYINMNEDLLEHNGVPGFIRQSDITGLTVVTQSHEFEGGAIHQVANIGPINSLTVLPTANVCSKCSSKTSAEFTRCPNCGHERLVNPYSGYLVP
jgi:hypothetical protein